MRQVIVCILIFVAGLGTGFFLWGLDDVDVSRKMNDLVTRAPASQPGSERDDVKTKALSAPEITDALVGTWESVDDARFNRTFSVDATVIDAYEGDVSATSEGRWAVFTAPEGEPPPFPIAKGTVYLKISTIEEVLYFSVLTLDSSKLELAYLDGGGVQIFKRQK